MDSVSLEVYISILKKTEKNNKLVCYTDPFDSEISFTKLKDKVAQLLGLSDISVEDLEHEIYRPNIIETPRKIPTEKN